MKDVKFQLKNNLKKAKKCKVEGCNKILRANNKSGYCSKHSGKINTTKFREGKSTVFINESVKKRFVDYCYQKGFIISRKLEIIIVDFLKEQTQE